MTILKEKVQLKIRQNDVDVILSFKIKKYNKTILKNLAHESKNNLLNIKDCIECFIDQLNNYREDFISGNLSDEYMINKYGHGFLNKINEFSDEDYSYFSSSLFFGYGDNTFKIVPTDKLIYFITNTKMICLDISSNIIEDFKELVRVINKYYSYNI